MSATCEMTIDVIGSDEEFNNILAKMHEIEGDKNFKYPLYPHYPFQVNERSIYCHNGSCSNVWGWNYLEPEEDMFLELAKAAPNASFEVNSSRLYEGGGGGCESYLHVEYENRKLTFRLQAYVDSMSLADLVNGEFESDKDEIRIAVVGKLNYHANAYALKRYLEMYDITLMPNVSNETDYIICNNPDEIDENLEKAKELNIPIITEAAAIRMFGDIYDFDDPDELTQDFTYEELCAMYEVDESVTREAFEEAKKSGWADFILSGNHVSFDGPWEETVYVLNENNEFE